ncbi:MAG: FecR domain-containing protein [Colwellia sp.]|nr:FecR domain-containing protein [Colwellia sp.]
MKEIDKNTNNTAQLNEQLSEKISDEATQWLLTIAEDNSIANQQALQVWLLQSSLHQQTYNQLQSMWQMADELSAELFEEDLAQLSIPEKTKDNLVALTSIKNETSNFLVQLKSFFTLRRTLYMASFASTVIAVLLILPQTGQGVKSLTTPLYTAKQNTLRANEYQTELGQHQTITAKDGSVIVLAAKSRVFVDYSAAQRDIYLLSGEALFTVAKDKNRPFVVHNQGRTVQALGTIFNVRESKTVMEVAVLEGVVEVKIQPKVSNSQTKPQQITTLIAGQAIHLDKSDRFSDTLIFEISERMAWQNGRLNYINTHLANVIFDLKRYSELTIHIPDNQVASLGYTGSVIYDKVDDWLIALPYIFPVEVQRHGNTVIIAKRETH